MRLLLLFTTIFGVLKLNAQDVVASCETTELVVDLVEETGAPIFEKQQLDLKVFVDTDTEYGFSAEIALGGEKQVIKDTNHEVITQLDEQISEMATVLLPQINLDSVKKVGVSNISVKNNLEDGAGIYLLSLFNESNELLGQMGTIGWSFFRCKNQLP